MSESASVPSGGSPNPPSATSSSNQQADPHIIEETKSNSSLGSGTGSILSSITGSRRGSRDGGKRRGSRDGLLKGDEKRVQVDKKKKKKKPNKKDLLDGSERLHNVKQKDRASPILSAPLSADAQKASELMFGHDVSHLPHVNLEDDAFADWYRKTSGMHTVETWLQNYQKHPYAWGALIMIHGVDEVSARLRSKVENYAVYSAVLLSASVVLLVMPEINENFLSAHWFFQRLFLYSMLVSVVSHLTSILLSMMFVNALNEAGRDADVIRMFGEGQGYLATAKCSRAFSTGIVALAVGILDMVLINFSPWDMLACLAIGSSIMYKLVPTSKKLFESSSLMSYWRFGRAEDNEDPFDLRVPLERVRTKAVISERLYAIIRGAEGGEGKVKDKGKEEGKMIGDDTSTIEEGAEGEPDMSVGVKIEEGGKEWEETVPVVMKEKGIRKLVGQTVVSHKDKYAVRKEEDNKIENV